MSSSILDTNIQWDVQNKLLFIFLSTFFITLISLIYLATAFTPKIDIEVNETQHQSEQIPQDEENMVAEVEYKSIDSRLKDIQMDDKYLNSPESQETSDIVANLKKMKEETIAKQMKNEDGISDEMVGDIQTPSFDVIKLNPPKLATPQYSNQQKNFSVSQPVKKVSTTATKMTKVYVGKYADFEQAALVQDALVKSSLVSAPFIKNLNGYYVVQVGSFSNMEAAQNVAELLISNGYSAKMVLE